MDGEDWYLTYAKETMDKGELKKRKQDDTRSFQEVGWSLTYEDDMSIGDETNHEELQAGTTINDENTLL
jgi:hypothetical protein